MHSRAAASALAFAIQATARSSNSASIGRGANCSGPPTSSERLPLPITANRRGSSSSSSAERSARPTAWNRAADGSGGAMQLLMSGTIGRSSWGRENSSGTTIE